MSNQAPDDSHGAIPSSVDERMHRKELSQREIALGLSGVAVSATIVAFDATIISTILPEVANSLDGMGLYSWAAAAYFLAVSCTILVFGRLSDLVGRKALMLCSLLVVSVGSMTGGLANGMEVLIVGRVIQGIGGGMLIGTAFAAPADLLPDPKVRVKWMAFLSATYAVASAAGPALGGALTESFGWRAAFFVIPLTAVCAAPLLWAFYPPWRRALAAPLKMDWLGLLLLVYALGVPLMALEQFARPDSTWPDWLEWSLIVSGFVAGWLLLKWEKTQSTPMFPVRILRTLPARLLNLSSVISGAVMFSLIYYVPLLLQASFNLSPTTAGLLIAPIVAGAPVGSIINGRLFAHVKNPQYIMLTGALILAAGCGLLLTLTEQSSLRVILLIMGLCGVGLGLLLSNYNLLMQIVVGHDNVGAGTGLIQTTRALGSAIGTTLVGLAIAHSSIKAGIQLSLAVCVVLCLVTAYLTWRTRLPEQD